ncbi:ras-related protein Rab-3A-like isoform X1 [Lagopus leucura]|uniref:ras-related protein Rab-3A-like isoform X1 n=2 Tax=Lagopus leucura TaxID=30410 RepID=UPI001C67B286|nr:ras-related protein Rab-3A-like isoform X1 [Lagopus leucura]
MSLRRWQTLPTKPLICISRHAPSDVTGLCNRRGGARRCCSRCGERGEEMASATDSRYGQKESSDQNFDYMFKILIIGNSSVGKTSFLFRYADDSFTPAFVSTVGIDFKVKTIYRNDKRIKLQIWVSAGGQGLGQD